jgi:hypothetical protein
MVFALPFERTSLSYCNAVPLDLGFSIGQYNLVVENGGSLLKRKAKTFDEHHIRIWTKKNHPKVAFWN